MTADELRKAQDERAAEAKRLRAFARALRREADRIDLAATYWDDGAYHTTHGILTAGRNHGKAPELPVTDRVGLLLERLLGKKWVKR